MNTLFLLVCGHAVADFGLQSEWAAANKVPGRPYWYHMMASHCLMHALGVFLATQSLGCAVGEMVAHFAIDTAKSQGKIGFELDQFLHLLCKMIWWVLIQ